MIQGKMLKDASIYTAVLSTGSLVSFLVSVLCPSFPFSFFFFFFFLAFSACLLVFALIPPFCKLFFFFFFSPSPWREMHMLHLIESHARCPSFLILLLSAAWEYYIFNCIYLLYILLLLGI